MTLPPPQGKSYAIVLIVSLLLLGLRKRMVTPRDVRRLAHFGVTEEVAIALHRSEKERVLRRKADKLWSGLSVY